jgi:hypothetical protein
MNGVILIVTYAVICAAGFAIAVAGGLVSDQINAGLSLLVFFAVAAIAVTFAWPVTLRLTKPVS